MLDENQKLLQAMIMMINYFHYCLHPELGNDQKVGVEGRDEELVSEEVLIQLLTRHDSRLAARTVKMNG